MMRLLLTVCFLAWAALLATAQNLSVILPLEAELNTCKDTQRLIQIHSKLLEEYNIFYIPKGKRSAEILWNLGEATQDQETMWLAALYLSGIYHNDLNDNDHGLKWALTAMEISKKMGDINKTAHVAYRIALINMDSRDMQRAFTHFKMAQDLAAAAGDYHMVVFANIAMGDEETDNAQRLAYYQAAQKAADQIPQDTTIRIQMEVTLGDYYWDLKESKKAQQHYEKVYLLGAGDNFDPNANVECLQMVAHACLRLGRYDECIQLSNLLVNSGFSNGASPWLKETSTKILAEAYYRNGNDSLAYNTMLQYVQLHDSINIKRFNQQIQDRVLNVQAELELKQQAEQLELIKEKSKYETILAYVLIMAIFFLCGVIYYLYRVRVRQNLQNQKLAQFNQTKDKLLSIISHDVRSPIQALQNIIRLFEQQIATKEDVQTVTRQVNASVQSMATGLDNLFYWAQNQQQELRAYPESIQLSNLVETQVEQYKPMLNRKQLTLVNNLPPSAVIYSDLLHTRLAFNNIFANAIKFTPSGGTISLAFMVTREKEGLLEIKNTGTPIREEDLPKIFDPAIRYTRVGTSGEPGSGLGLSLTRDLMRLNNGRINIRREEAIGTVVELYFKLDKS